MNTDDLVDRLAAEAGPPGLPPTRRALLALGLGLVPSLVLYAIVMRPRADLVSAIETARVLFKLGAAGLAVAIAASLLPSLLDPTGRAGLRRHLPWLLGTAIVLAVAAELLALPTTAWLPNLVGRNALFCLTMLPSLALGPFAALMLAARFAAPMAPGRAGAAIGFLSASVAALLYATHCPDDSPLFVATWYGLAVLVMTGLGAALGQKLLRW